jgi:hypothetical protein
MANAIPDTIAAGMPTKNARLPKQGINDPSIPINPNTRPITESAVTAPESFSSSATSNSSFQGF